MKGSDEMVFITGDCHADFRKFSVDAFPEQKEMTRDDIVIVCGDFGLWHDTNEERYWLDWLNDKPFTTVFVDGNHENFDRLYSGEFKSTRFKGGMAHQIRDNVYHLMRGEIFEFGGKKFFAFGGAKSHDIDDGILDRADFESDDEFKKTVKKWRNEHKFFRINHLSWWEQELPDETELSHGLQTLIQNNDKVDYIITHCAPAEVSALCGYHDADRLTQWFNMVAHTVDFHRWFFGHYHDNKQIMSKFIMLYEQIVRIL